MLKGLDLVSDRKKLKEQKDKTPFGVVTGVSPAKHLPLGHSDRGTDTNRHTKEVAQLVT